MAQLEFTVPDVVTGGSEVEVGPHPDSRLPGLAASSIEPLELKCGTDRHGSGMARERLGALRSREEARCGRRADVRAGRESLIERMMAEDEHRMCAIEPSALAEFGENQARTP